MSGYHPPPMRRPSSSRRRRSLFGASVSLAAAAFTFAESPRARATTPPTIYDNYQNFPIGGRAAGMGGAYTSLACDEAALHYNPASLACAGASRLELSANAYILNGYSVPNAFGKGEDVQALTFHAVPSIVGGVRILRDGDPETKAGRVAFGLAVSVPQSIAINADPTSRRRSFFRFRVRDDLTALDVGLAVQLTRWLGVGLGLGAALRTEESSSSALVASSGQYLCGPGPFQAEQLAGAADGCHGFFATDADESTVAVGGRARLGVRITPDDRLAFGLAVTSPSVDVYGQSDAFYTDTFAIPVQFPGDGANPPDPLATALYDAAPTRIKGKSDLGLPMRLAVGASWTLPRLTLSGDVSVNLPHTVKIAHSLRAVKIEGVESPPKSSLKDTVLDRGVQPNVNLGAEIGVTEAVVLDLGAFTDLSSVSAKDASAKAAVPQDRIHMFGGSVGLGILSRQSRGWFGMSFEVGQGASQVVRGDLTLDNAVARGLGFDAKSTATRWTLAGMLGSTYSFLPD